MLSRRAFLGTGFAALSAGLLARRSLAFAPTCPDTGAVPYGSAAPVLDLGDLPDPIMVNGLPFAPGWTGDWFPAFNQIPFHSTETLYPNGTPPDPTETVDVCIVGGGLSGLTTAYLLRQFRPVILELHPRFGGVAKGESWRGINYSLGGAYFMTPDPGTFLDSLYRELGLDRLYKFSKDPDPTELQGDLVNDIFHSPRLTPEERAALDAYRGMVRYFMDHYPDIPLVPGRDNAWILELDRRSFKDDVEMRLGGPAPALLASLIQGYFFSSFGAGWDRISAASGWNFVAAEEWGRWVLPGGNSGFVQALYDRLTPMEQQPSSCAGQYLRAGCRAVDVRMLPDGTAKVVYKDSTGGFRALRARRVVMCCSKHIAKYVLSDPLSADPVRMSAMHAVETMAYVVVNILLNAPAPRSFYDIFMLGDGNYPMDEKAIEAWSRITDFVDGGYAHRGSHSSEVLTCYWPLPWNRSRASIAADDAWTTYAQMTTRQVRPILDLLGVPHRSVAQIRMTRWGHAFPIAGVGLIARGVLDTIRAPINNVIYFVEQDNWALPAVETCLLEAAEWAPRIAQGL